MVTIQTVNVSYVPLLPSQLLSWKIIVWQKFQKHWFIHLISSIQLLWVKVRVIINQTWENNYILVWDGRKEKILKWNMD